MAVLGREDDWGGHALGSARQWLEARSLRQKEPGSVLDTAGHRDGQSTEAWGGGRAGAEARGRRAAPPQWRVPARSSPTRRCSGDRDDLTQ